MLDTSTPSTHQSELVTALADQKYWFAAGAENFANWEFYSQDDWTEFAQCWDDLLLDEHMRDGGTYRYRRYSQFEYDTVADKLTLLEHAPYEQSMTINKLNGGFKRHYEPLEMRMIENEFFRGLMAWMAQAYSGVSGHKKWNIKLHPYRIVATEGAGDPSPEGLHRDGVDFITSFMIKKCNVSGGVSTITTPEEVKLSEVTLEQPGDIVIADDEQTKHGVSPIEIIDSNKSVAYRDVFVIAFTHV